jgi:hypothetical protein
VQSKTPSLGDVTSRGVDSFNEKQKSFRDQLAAQQKAQTQPSAISPSLSSSPSFSSSSVISDTNPFRRNQGHDTPTAPEAATSDVDSVSNASATPLSNELLGLGALSTAKNDSLDTEPVVANDEKPTGKLSSLIYGTKEGRQMDREIEQSFSQVLARGKYVHSIVFHQVKPDKVDEYVELVGKWYPKMAAMPENKVHLVGSWRTEVGDCDTFGQSYHHQPPLFQPQSC